MVTTWNKSVSAVAHIPCLNAAYKKYTPSLLNMICFVLPLVFDEKVVITVHISDKLQRPEFSQYKKVG